MEFNSPKVSIGLPVFNGEKYISQAIDSILNQSFTDFELIICDNASVDRTEHICRDYAARDSRIRYYRNGTNIGGSRNQNLTISLARGEYFHIGAADDLLAPDLLAKCVEVLDQNPFLSLCYSLVIEIDAHGIELGKLEIESLANSTKRDERFKSLLKAHRVDFLYGLIRTSILHKTELEPPYPESDLIFACELGLYGQFYRIPEFLFYRRTHEKAFTTLNLDDKIVWTQPEIQNASNIFQSFWAIYYLSVGLPLLEGAHLFRIIFRSPLKTNERILCLMHSFRWLFRKFLIAPSWKLRQKLLLNRASISNVGSLLKLKAKV